MALLEVENLTHSFGDKLLYKDSSFELYKGEHMGIVGQNGAGKSTLIKILLGEILPDKGVVKWQNGITNFSLAYQCFNNKFGVFAIFYIQYIINFCFRF